eukprot:jgi/Botrbrau1/20990/Bobra.0144s0009.1
MLVLLEGFGCLGRPCCSLHLRGNVAIVGRQYSVHNGLYAFLTSAHQRVTWEPTFTTSVPGQERRRADLRLHAWEEGRDLFFDIVGSSPRTVGNLQHWPYWCRRSLEPGSSKGLASMDVRHYNRSIDFCHCNWSSPSIVCICVTIGCLDIIIDVCSRS